MGEHILLVPVDHVLLAPAVQSHLHLDLVLHLSQQPGLLFNLPTRSTLSPFITNRFVTNFLLNLLIIEYTEQHLHGREPNSLAAAVNFSYCMQDDPSQHLAEAGNQVLVQVGGLHPNFPGYFWLLIQTFRAEWISSHYHANNQQTEHM